MLPDASRAGAANAALSGGGVKGALLGAGMGALGSGATKALAGKIPGLNNVGSFGAKAAPAMPGTVFQFPTRNPYENLFRG